MALTYNTNIFTRVSKYNKNGEPYGILVSGKLNQYNQQGYPILDAIDIDWNNAIIPGLNDNNPISNTSEFLKLISNLSSTNTQIDFETLREEINALVNSKHQVMTYAEYIALEEKDPNEYSGLESYVKKNIDKENF